MQRDGRVSGLHALLVSRGGKVLFEHYGAVASRRRQRSAHKSNT
jgi:hypothetical protein